MGLEDYQQSARYRQRLAQDYRELFPNLIEPDDQSLANLTSEIAKAAYEKRLPQIESIFGNNQRDLEKQRAKLTAAFQHLLSFIDERDSVARRIGADPLMTETKEPVSEFKSTFLIDRRKVKIIAVGGGKGGIGKSLVAANLAIALATMGKQVVAIDMDLGGADLHFNLGLRNLKKSLNDFLDHQYETLEEVRLVTPYRNLSLIATDSSRLGAANIKFAHKEKIMRHLAKLNCDVVIVDLGAEVSFNVLDIFLAADARYVVTSTEPTSVLEAYGLIKLSLYRKIRHFAGELIPPGSELGQKVDAFLFERHDEETNGKADTVWTLLDLVSQADSELNRKLLKLLWNYRIGLVVNMSERNGDAGIATTMARLCQENLSLNLARSYLVPMDKKVRDCAKRMIPLVIEAPSSPAARVMMQIASDVAEAGVTEEEISAQINAIALAAKERVRKMGEMSALGTPGQPINKIAPLDQPDVDSTASRIREFLNKEIHFKRTP